MSAVVTSPSLQSSAPTEVLLSSYPEPENEAFWAQAKAHVLNVAFAVSFVAAAVFFGAGAVTAALNFSVGYSLAYLVGGFFALAAISSTLNFIQSYQSQADFFYAVGSELKVIENYTHAQMLDFLRRNEIDTSRIPSRVDITARPCKILTAYYVYCKKLMVSTQEALGNIRRENQDLQPLRLALHRLSWSCKLRLAEILQKMYAADQAVNRTYSIVLPMTEEEEANRLRLGSSTPFIRFNERRQPDIAVSEMDSLSIRQLHQRLFQRI